MNFKFYLLLIKLNTVNFALCLDSMESPRSIEPVDDERIIYPLSAVNLIVDYFKNYKHIKRLTLFLCDGSSTTPSSYQFGTESSPLTLHLLFNQRRRREQKQELYANSILNFQQIVKHLMVTGNFLINGDGNIDGEMEHFTDPLYVPDMLKCGDFKQGVVLDLRCRQSKFIFQQASEYGLFNTSYHWLILAPPSLAMRPSPASFSSLGEVEFFESLNINMNSEITLAKPHQSSIAKVEWDKYDLYDMWNSGNLYGGKLNLTHMGFYSSNNKLLNITFRETTIIRRLNVNGIHIRTMIVITNKFNESFDKYLDHNYSPHLDSMNRFNYRLLTYVRDMFNFRWIVYRTNSWGYLKNGVFDGMVGALVRKEIDVGGSPIFFRSERAKVIDYTARTWISRPCFVFRHPTGQLRNVFLQPFTNYVWYCVLLCGCLIIFITTRITYREAKNYRTGKKQILAVNQTTENLKHQQYLQNFRLNNKGQNRKLENNNDMVVMSGKRQRPMNSMLNKNRQKQATSQWKIYQQQQIISKNIIIRIWNKVLSNCYLPSIKGNEKTKCPAHKKQIKKRRNLVANERISQKNFHLNSPADDCNGNNSEADDIFDNDDDRIDCSENGGGSNRNNTMDNDIDDIDYDVSTFSRCLLLFLGALCQQGSSELPNVQSRRLVIFVMLLFGFAIFQFYSASIVGSLLMEKPKTIKTLRNLIDSPLSLGIEDIVYNKDFFRRTTDADALELYSKKVRIVNAKTGNVTFNYLNPADGMEKVKDGGFAFHADSATFYKIVSDDFSEHAVCELSEIELFPEQHMMSIVQKGSPLRKMITYGLRRTFESGLLYHERKRWHAPKPICVRKIQPEDLKVRFDTVSSAHIVLLAGILTSIILLILENIVWKLNSRISNERIQFLH